jgi:hypothetical protein
MAARSPAAFWSYAHDDDEAVGRDITRLARRIKASHDLLTGTSLVLFVDRTSVEWGDEWRARIDDALLDSTFLIPILSPRYFQREECRYELQAFVDKAGNPGVSEFVMPILYVQIPEFNAENPDPLVALASRMQYEAWTSLRLEDPESPGPRRAVHRLTSRLVALQPASVPEEPQLRAEFQRALADIEAKLPILVAAVQRGNLFAAQIDVSRRVMAEMARRSRGRRWSEHGVYRGLLLEEWGELRMFEDRRLAAAEMQLDSAESLNAPIARAIKTARRYPELRTRLVFVEESIREVSAYMPALLLEADHPQTPVGAGQRGMPDMVDVAPRVRKLLREANAMITKWVEQIGTDFQQRSG